MTAYVHIGASKTGTTTIQNFMAKNYEILKEKGFLYPKSLAAWGYNHCDLFYICRYLQTKDESLKYYYDLLENFKIKQVILNNDEYNGLELKIIEVLKQKKIKYSQNIQELILNDNLPIDYKKILDLTIVENMKKNIKDYREKGVKIDENEFKIFKKEIKSFILNTLNFSQVNINQLNQFRNIVCFTTNYKSTLMWGHYADSHKGFVLEYDLKDYIKKCLNIECNSKNKCINLGLKPLIAPIIYEENRKQGNIYIFQEILNKLNQSINSTSSHITLDYLFLTKCLLRKSKEWEYEDEWRLFSSIYSNNDIKKYKVVLPDDKSSDYNLIRPKAIYMGINIPEKRKNDLQVLCKALKIQCYQMAVDQYSDKFEIDTEEELKKKYDSIFKIEGE